MIREIRRVSKETWKEGYVSQILGFANIFTTVGNCFQFFQTCKFSHLSRVTFHNPTRDFRMKNDEYVNLGIS